MQRKESEYPKWGENHCSRAKTFLCLVKHHTAKRAHKMEIGTRCEPRQVTPCIGNLTEVPPGIVEPSYECTEIIPHSIHPTFLRFPYSTLTLPLLLARLTSDRLECYSGEQGVTSWQPLTSGEISLAGSTIATF
jgi:hypothetical protein